MHAANAIVIEIGNLAYPFDIQPFAAPFFYSKESIAKGPDPNIAKLILINLIDVIEDNILIAVIRMKELMIIAGFEFEDKKASFFSAYPQDIMLIPMQICDVVIVIRLVGICSGKAGKFISVDVIPDQTSTIGTNPNITLLICQDTVHEIASQRKGILVIVFKSFEIHSVKPVQAIVRPDPEKAVFILCEGSDRILGKAL
jgi:hypothetical protein